MKVYHNPRCSKSRCAVDWLKENNIDFEVVEYLKNPLTKAELLQILTQLNISASALVRKSEEEYNQYIKNETLSEDEILDLIVKFPKLIERPIVVGDTFAVIARPLENLVEKLKKNN
jgi:arsenate reductase